MRAILFSYFPNNNSEIRRLKAWIEELEANIATLAGGNGELSLPALETEIRRMQERQMELFQMAVSAGPECLDYDEEIQG